jgi:hypothetical protein
VTFLLLVSMAAATYRLTRLVVVDGWPPVARPRERWAERHPGHWLTYLWNCPFCVSVWAAGLVVLLTWVFLHDDGPGMALPVLQWGAVAGLAALVYEVLARLADV